nr:SDR family NAD(P)-dependent oxidoreductase [Streptococcus sp. DD11]
MCLCSSLSAGRSPAFLLGRHVEKVQRLAQKTAAEYSLASFEIGSEESLQAAVEAIRSWSDQVDIIINATGFDVRKSLSAHSTAEIKQTLDTNLLGAVLLTKCFLPLLSDKASSTLVHTGGFADGRLAFPYYSVDVASRAGVFSFIEAMNRELRAEGRKKYITYFCPNAAATPSEAPYHPVWREMGLAISSPAEVCQALLKGIRKRRRVILMGAGTGLFAKINLLSPSLADFLLLNQYSRILKHYFAAAD